MTSATRGEPDEVRGEVGARPCGLARRLCCVFYDAILLCAVLLAGAAFALVAGLAVFRLWLGEQVLPADSAANQVWLALIAVWLIALTFGYFAYPWVRSGQTLGMKTWRVHLVCTDGSVVSWRRAALRFVLALLSWLPGGLGHWWAAVDRDCLAWHDRGSRTRLLEAPRHPRP